MNNNFQVISKNRGFELALRLLRGGSVFMYRHEYESDHDCGIEHHQEWWEVYSDIGGTSSWEYDGTTYYAMISSSNEYLGLEEELEGETPDGIYWCAVNAVKESEPEDWCFMPDLLEALAQLGYPLAEERDGFSGHRLYWQEDGSIALPAHITPVNYEVEEPPIRARLASKKRWKA